MVVHDYANNVSQSLIYLLGAIRKNRQCCFPIYLDIDPDKDKIVIIYLPINLTMCFGCSKEPSY